MFIWLSITLKNVGCFCYLCIHINIMFHQQYIQDLQTSKHIFKNFNLRYKWVTYHLKRFVIKVCFILPDAILLYYNKIFYCSLGIYYWICSRITLKPIFPGNSLAVFLSNKVAVMRKQSLNKLFDKRYNVRSMCVKT